MRRVSRFCQSSSAAARRWSFELKYRYTVANATPERWATSRICTASAPVSAIRSRRLR